MKRKNNQRSEYYQSIARYFFKQRGAPFFLSSADLDLVEKWEKMEIPLPVVLEGVKRAFDNYRRKPGRKTRIQTLAYCENQVLKAFDQHRDRRVGRERKRMVRTEKKNRARDEIKKFLSTLPDQIGYLKDAYSRAQRLFSHSHVDEEELERIEGEVEELIWEQSLEEERERIKADVRAEYKIEEGEEFLRILRIKLVKALRDRYKIPYISLFYY
ncbi:MAG: hypothetical protein PVI11_08205 [Candidatus Aminicenantes bacterium]